MVDIRICGSRLLRGMVGAHEVARDRQERFNSCRTLEAYERTRGEVTVHPVERSGDDEEQSMRPLLEPNAAWKCMAFIATLGVIVMTGQANADRSARPASAGWHVWTEIETRHVL